ncbi:hypothetical protein ACJ73_01722 [Blastomyces percursus]|uniref:Uncharacterized protein n=1 Tax=Blastomyces percursus TaxID=1658174 RepID=A0A1J9RFX3_9EURO|nr:hypothetical protein ACJ73_01722 [Blastomyces percursus]
MTLTTAENESMWETSIPAELLEVESSALRRVARTRQRKFTQLARPLQLPSKSVYNIKITANDMGKPKRHPLVHEGGHEHIYIKRSIPTFYIIEGRSREKDVATASSECTS